MGQKTRMGHVFEDFAVGQQMAPLNGPAIDKGAVAAVQVFDKELVTLAQDLGMLPTDAGGVEHDFAVGMASHHHAILIQGNVFRDAGRVG